MSTKKEKCCEKCLSTNGWMKGECFNGNCTCHQTESIEWGKEFDGWANNVIEHESERKWAKYFISQAITTAVAKRDGYLVEEVEKISLRKEVMHDHKYIVEKTGKEIKAEVLSILKH